MANLKSWNTVAKANIKNLNGLTMPVAVSWPFTEDWEAADWQTKWDEFKRASDGSNQSANFVRNTDNKKSGTAGCGVSTSGNMYLAINDLGELPATASLWFRYDASAGLRAGIIVGAGWDADPDYVGGLTIYFVASEQRLKSGVLDANGAATEIAVSGNSALTDGNWYKIVVTYVDNGNDTSRLSGVLYDSDGTTSLKTVNTGDKDNTAFTTEFCIMCMSSTGNTMYIDDFTADD